VLALTLMLPASTLWSALEVRPDWVSDLLAPPMTVRSLGGVPA